MDIERYLAELCAWRSWTETSERRPAGDSPASVTWERESGRWREQAHGLVATEAVVTAAHELEAAGDPWSLRALEFVADAAVTHRCMEAALEAGRSLADPLAVGAGTYLFEEVEVWLATEPDRRVREAARDTLDTASERVGAAAAARASCMRSAAGEAGLPDAWELWARARERDLVRVAGWAAGLIDHGAESGVLAAESSVARLDHWSELPAFVVGPRDGITLPDPDAALLEFVAAGLAVGRLAAERIGLDLDSRHGKPARDLVRRQANGRRVLAARRPIGVLRDYRGTLRLFGRALSMAASEGPVEPADLADPGLQGLYGALLEGQILRPGWQERAFGRAAPGAVQAAWRRQSAVRTMRLAGETLEAVSGSRGHPAVPAPGTASAGSLLLGPRSSAAPWSSSAGEAADELAGRILAPELDDLLSRRFGRAWSLNSRAGSFLRELWATPHPTLDALSRDLGLDGPGIAPLLDTWSGSGT